MKTNNNLTINERLVSTYVPYSHHVTNHIIACDNYEYLAIIKVAGRAPDAYDQSDLKEWIESLHNVLRGLSMGALGLYSHVVRRKVTEYPEANFKQTFANKFNVAYRSTFNTSGLMVNDLYLTVLIHPV